VLEILAVNFLPLRFVKIGKQGISFHLSVNAGEMESVCKGQSRLVNSRPSDHEGLFGTINYGDGLSQLYRFWQ
jgi:hypothetical protein